MTFLDYKNTILENAFHEASCGSTSTICKCSRPLFELKKNKSIFSLAGMFRNAAENNNKQNKNELNLMTVSYN